MFVGIEIGGTKLQAGLGDGSGELVALERCQADAENGAARIRTQLLDLVARLRETAARTGNDVEAIGIGFGGPVDVKTGTIARSHQVAGWEGFGICRWIEQQTGLGCTVQNDADTAGLAEALLGAGRGHNPVFYLTIGSGIGGGLILDGRIYRGAGAGASELGHLQIPCWLQVDALHRTVESQASGWAIGRRMRERIVQTLGQSTEPGGVSIEPGRDPIVANSTNLGGAAQEQARKLIELAGGDLGKVSAQTVAQGVVEENALAVQVMDETIEVLGWAIAQVVALLCPKMIVVGGGVSLMPADLLLNPLRKRVGEIAFGPFRNQFTIAPASLGEAVVVHGAILVAGALVTESRQR